MELHICQSNRNYDTLKFTNFNGNLPNLTTTCLLEEHIALRLEVNERW
jgi:hypothetical protein